MEIKRKYEEKEKFANIIKQKANSNDVELDKILSNFNDIPNVITKTFIDKLDVPIIVAILKDNHVNIMHKFSEKVVINNEVFEEADEGIAGDIS